MGMSEVWWEVIMVQRRGTLRRAGGRDARHAAMLRSRRPYKCDGCVKKTTLRGVGKDRAGTPRGTPISSKCVGMSYAIADKSSVRGIRISGDRRSDRAHARFVARARREARYGAQP